MGRVNFTLEERLNSFFSKVEKTRGCWFWTASKDELGYGMSSYKGKNLRAHRLSYLLFIGPLVDGKIILHSCDNPSCVNPRHLSQGTKMDNSLDCRSKGRNKKWKRNGFCRNGHDITGPNSLILIKASGYTTCRQCVALQNKRRWKIEKERRYPNEQRI